MKAEFRESEGAFGIELIAETAEETRRAARMGLTAKKGAKVFIYFGESETRIGLSFDKNKNKFPSIQK